MLFFYIAIKYCFQNFCLNRTYAFSYDVDATTADLSKHVSKHV